MAAHKLILYINGQTANADNIDLRDSLVSFIRNVSGLKGTKSNCDYGCSGACTVILSSWNGHQSRYDHRAVSGCATPLGSTHRCHVTTVEWLGTKDKPHEIQSRLVSYHGVQCGYESPGVVMSMYGLLLNSVSPSMQDVQDSQVGNLSRCSGYRAVLEAFKVFTERQNNEAASLEARLPEGLKMMPLETEVVFSQGVSWNRITGPRTKIKALLKEKDCRVVQGIPELATVRGESNIIDLSMAEKSITPHQAGVEVSANTRVSELVDWLVSHNQTKLSPELVRVLKTVRTHQWRVARGLRDALGSCLELQVLFLTMKVEIVITDTKCSLGFGKKSTVSLEKALPNLLDLHVESIVIPFLHSEEHLLFYGVAPRKGNAANTRSAAFMARMKGEVIIDCKGTMATTQITRIDTGMKQLQGKNISKMEIKTGDLKEISEDLMIQNLIYKFLLELKILVTGSQTDTTKLWESRCYSRVPISSTQFSEVGWDSHATSISPLGQSVPLVTGLSLTTGQGVFIEDMPSSKTELFMSLVCSSVSHATILQVDPTMALALPGVVRFIDASDVPEGKNIFKCSGGVDEQVFADKLVEFEGHPIGAILASSEKVARQGAALVKVRYQEHKPILTIQEAIAENSYIQVNEAETPASYTKGDVEEALANSETVLAGEIQTTRQEHYYEEINNCVVIPVGEDDEYKVFTPTANVITTQQCVAAVLGIPFNRVTITVKRVGCSFGGKISRFTPTTCATALAAKLTGRPVRCQLTRDQDNRITGQRGEFWGKYRLGVTDGKITGASYQMYKNAGWNSDCSPDIMATALLHLDAAYEFPTFHAQGSVCKTNTPSNTAFRAYGAPPSMTITENMIFDACVQLGLDPLKFRMNNLQRAGYVNHYGQEMTESDVTMAACLEEVITRTEYTKLRRDVDQFNLNNKWRKRGVYVIPNKYGLGMPKMFAQGFAQVHVFLDGSVMINHAGIECGQGIHTKMLQIASTELGIPMEKITVSDSANDKVPNPIPTGGSSTADLNGNAVKDACEQIVARLAPFKAAAEGAPWEMLVGIAFFNRVNLSAFGHYTVPEERSTFDPAIKKGKRWWYYTVGAACSTVEIDILTGEHTLLSADIVMDVGEAINPAIDIGQIEAAFIQGYGWISMENSTFTKDGNMETRGHDEYNIPCIADCPHTFNVSLLKSKSRSHILYSSKGIGEPPFFNGVSVYFAIKDAVRAARKHAGLEGKFSLNQPTTPENVVTACGSNIPN